MNTIICTQIKNEELYIKEWVNYHLNQIGICHIFLFEDYNSRSHKHLFTNESRVTISTLEEFGIPNYYNARNQVKLYKKFLAKCKRNPQYDWCLFIDVDEFITFDEEYDLEKIEMEYNDVSALLLSWKNYGANGHIKRPIGGVLENYTKPGPCVEDVNRWAKKCLVNLKKCDGLETIHKFNGAVDINRNSDIDADFIYKKAWINHYFTKSWEDFKERMFERGNMSNNSRTLDDFFKCNPDMMHLEKQLIYNERFRHTNNTMYLSKKYKLISGGNLAYINMMNQLELNKDK